MTVLPVPTETIPKSERKRAWRFRLSVRALMLFVLFVGGFLGWVLYRARPQREAVGAIKRAGGTVGYSGDDWPRWRLFIVDVIGRDYFDTVISDLAHFEGMTHLVRLDLGPTRVADAGLAHLRGLKNLQELQFSSEEISNEAMAKLKQERPKLQVVSPNTSPALAPPTPVNTSAPPAEPSDDPVPSAMGPL
jgi:hypothetical protein